MAEKSIRFKFRTTSQFQYRGEFPTIAVSTEGMLKGDETTLVAGKKRPYPVETVKSLIRPAPKMCRPKQIRNRKFTSDEDDRIIQFVTDCGGQCTNVQWLALDEELGRQNLSANLRWMNILKPRLRASLAEQSGAILAALATGQSPAKDLDLPPKMLINTLQYQRHTFTAEENERIEQFACERRSVTDQSMPWSRLDEELGRNIGACKHRYESVVRRAVKTTMKEILCQIEAAVPVPHAQYINKHPVQRKSVTTEVDLSRMTHFTPEEDAVIVAAVQVCPNQHMTTLRWRALEKQMNRPYSWLRYRWAILSRGDEKTQARRAQFSCLLSTAPVSETSCLEVTNVIEAMVGAVCDAEVRFPARASSAPVSAPATQNMINEMVVKRAHLVKARAAPSAPSALGAHIQEPTERVYTQSELAHICVQVTKCKEVGEDMWKLLSSPMHPPDTIKQFWQERQQRGGTILVPHALHPVQQAHFAEMVEEQLAFQMEQVWLSLAAHLRISPAQAQSTWSRLWFAVHFPELFPGGFSKQVPPSPFFSRQDDLVIILRMRDTARDRDLPCWMPDLATFLAKPVNWVATQWDTLLRQTQQLASSKRASRTTDQTKECEGHRAESATTWGSSEGTAVQYGSAVKVFQSSIVY